MEIPCEVCKEAISKYRCPGCLMKTCSLPCVKKHKLELNCDGQRDKAAYVGIKEFSEKHLLNDYIFLEQVKRSSDLALKNWMIRQRDRPKHLVSLIREAFHRGTKVYLLPFGTSRRMNNTTFFHFSDRVIYWQVEWVFLDASYKYIDKKLNEQTILLNALRERFCNDCESAASDDTVEKAVEKQRLQRYMRVDPTEWRLHLLQEKRRADKPRYWRLDSTDTLREALSGTVITEYPRIFVTLPKSKFKFKLMKGSKGKSKKKEEDCTGETSTGAQQIDQQDNQTTASLPGQVENTSSTVPSCSLASRMEETPSDVTQMEKTPSDVTQTAVELEDGELC